MVEVGRTVHHESYVVVVVVAVVVVVVVAVVVAVVDDVVVVVDDVAVVCRTSEYQGDHNSRKYCWGIGMQHCDRSSRFHVEDWSPGNKFIQRINGGICCGGTRKLKNTKILKRK